MQYQRTPYDQHGPSAMDYAQMILDKYAGWVMNPITQREFVQVAPNRFGCDLMLED